MGWVMLDRIFVGVCMSVVTFGRTTPGTTGGVTV